MAVEGAVQNLTPVLATSLTTVLSIFGGSVNPALSILFASAYGFFGYYLSYQQERLNDFADWIKNHPNEFSEQLIQLPAFQQGFFPSLEAYLQVRTKQKIRLVQQIFLGFIRSNNKEEFELERFYEIIKLISSQQIVSLHNFHKNKNIKLLEEGEDRSENFYHESYEALRSLEALGIVMTHTNIKIENREKYIGKVETGFALADRSEAIPKKYEFAELTDFGKDFISYIEKFD